MIIELMITDFSIHSANIKRRCTGLCGLHRLVVTLVSHYSLTELVNAMTRIQKQISRSEPDI